MSALYLHAFGITPPGALCNEAMGRILQPIHEGLACSYFQEAAWIAEALGRNCPEADMPAVLQSSALLEARYWDGAYQAQMLQLGQTEPIDWSAA